MSAIASGSGPIDRFASRRIAVLLVVAAMVATAGCSGLLPGEDDGDDPVQYVPADQEALIHVDAAIVQDQTTLDLSEVFSEQEIAQDDLQGALDDFEAETGLDPSGFEGVLVFGTSAGDGLEADASSADDVGIVVESDWDEAELLDAFESNGTAELEVRSYQGREVLYEPAETRPGETPTYLGVLGDGTFVVGSEAAVTGSLDVRWGDADAVSGPVLDAYEDAPDGLVTVATAVPESELPEDPGEEFDDVPVDFGSSAFEDIEAASGVYTTDGDRVRLETRLLTAGEQSAQELGQIAQGGVIFLQQDPEMAQYLQYVSVEQDGTSVVLSFEASVDEIDELADLTESP